MTVWSPPGPGPAALQPQQSRATMVFGEQK